MWHTIQDTLLIIHALGSVSQLAKTDIWNAYRIIPVHPEEQPFLALSWEGHVYIDYQLLFRLALAPANISAVVEALE